MIRIFANFEPKISNLTSVRCVLMSCLPFHPGKGRMINFFILISVSSEFFHGGLSGDAAVVYSAIAKTTSQRN